MTKLLNIPIHVEPVNSQNAYQAKLEELSVPLRGMTTNKVIAHFALNENVTLLKTTLSLCAECLVHSPAAVYQENGAVWITKICATHGRQTAVIENDADYYCLSNKDNCGKAYTDIKSFEIPAFDENSCCAEGESCTSTQDSTWQSNFADQRQNKSCTVLIEITNTCNLTCHVCYSESGRHLNKILPIAQFKDTINALIQQKKRLDSVQITGGEASLHPDFWQMVYWLAEQPTIKMIYVPSNGIVFSKPEVAEKLVIIKHKVLVLLQFDGTDQPVNQTLRAVSPEAMRLRLIAQLERLNIPMQLTMTLTPDLSETDITWVVQQAKRYRNVRLVALQPAFTSGRYELNFDPLHRLTLSDCIKGVVAGLDNSVSTNDFFPIPCSHPNCGWVTLFVRRYGFFANIARYIDLSSVMNKVAYKTQLAEQDMQNIVGTRKNLSSFFARLARRLVRPQDVFGIVIKPFMDKYNYDQDRINNCCHHITNTEGQLVSFCEYNARFRSSDSWQKFPNISTG